jgi:ketosteroid isomerase-like protein
MATPETDLIAHFYAAFQRRDAEAMVACYAPDVVFCDPAFGTLRGGEAGDMWRMLLARSTELTVSLENASVNEPGSGRKGVSTGRQEARREDGQQGGQEGEREGERQASANWVARYRFTQTNRLVVNRVHARFVFRGGLIAEHRDNFDIWAWSRQALGVKGLLLGWTPFLRRTVQAQARKSLAAYRARAR